MENEYFDILLVIPLEEELQEVKKVFTLGENRSTDFAFRYTIDEAHAGIRILIVQQEGMGKTHAKDAVTDAAELYDFGLIVCLGIAGALSSDLSLGDVVYTGDVVDVTDNGKADDFESDDGSELQIALSTTFYHTPRHLTAALGFVRTFPELAPLYEEWQQQTGRDAERLVTAPVPDSHGKDQTISRAQSKNGLVACGLVTSSAHYNNKLRAIDRKVLAIETESGGIFSAAQRRNLPALTIRGISDHADKNKKKTESRTKQSVRQLAALNAATFLSMQLRNPQFARVVKDLKPGRQDSSKIEAPAGPSQPDPAMMIRSISDLIDTKLRELSPDFKLQPKGYRLPVPRIREIEYGGGLGSGFSSDPIEIRDALETQNVVLLSMSRTYPDSSLPWVLAADLLTAEVRGRQVIPIVVNGMDIRPPNRGLFEVADYPFVIPAAMPGVLLVFIIAELPLASSTRGNFLEEQIKGMSEAAFVVITRSETQIVSESEFAASVGGQVFQLSGVSFLEIAHFVQKNFEITALEAEVIALRLRDTFRHFDLSAHPTYFAGISKEILQALLQANRRAELIQLAVDGYLSLVVAADQARIKLSRTTRETFLRRIAVDLMVRRTPLRQEDLVRAARDFAEQMDFEVDPIRFVTSFVDSGILRFEDDRVVFSLPFVASYLLASELVEDDDMAKTYFQLGLDDFDLNTFDIYAEIGPSEKIVEMVISGIERSIATFSLKKDEHVFLSDRLRPEVLKNLDRLDPLRKRLVETAEDVRQGKGDTKKKQRLLDIADRVREATADKAPFGKSEPDKPRTEQQENIRLAVHSWAVGIALLGAGAEGLTGETKQRLATAVTELSSLIMHHWTQAHADVDFAEIKRRLTSDDVIAEFLEGRDGKRDKAETRRLIEGVVDVLEFAFMAEPARRVLAHLCEGSRQRVLVPSIEKAKVGGTVEDLVHGLWLTDIDSGRGRIALREAIKALPASPFFRAVLAMHLLMRIYWSHSRKEDRLALLDAAEQVVKPVFSLPKAKIKRFVNSETDNLER